MGGSELNMIWWVERGGKRLPEGKKHPPAKDPGSRQTLARVQRLLPTCRGHLMSDLRPHQKQPRAWPCPGWGCAITLCKDFPCARHWVKCVPHPSPMAPSSGQVVFQGQKNGGSRRQRVQSLRRWCERDFLSGLTTNVMYNHSCPESLGFVLKFPGGVSPVGGGGALMWHSSEVTAGDIRVPSSECLVPGLVPPLPIQLPAHHTLGDSR